MDDVRLQRIERLLKDLEYEVVAGLSRGEVTGVLRSECLVPLGRETWRLRFELRPVENWEPISEPRGLHLVK